MQTYTSQLLFLWNEQAEKLEVFEKRELNLVTVHTCFRKKEEKYISYLQIRFVVCIYYKKYIVVFSFFPAPNLSSSNIHLTMEM